MLTKLYRIDEDWMLGYRPTLVSVTVKRTTTRYNVIGGNRSAFGFRSHVAFGDYAETPREAWERYLAHQKSSLKNAQETIRSARRNISIAKTRLKEF